MNALVLRNARTYGSAELADITIRGGMIERLAPAGATDGGIDLEGRWIGPGMWDAHVHFTQWVIGRSRVDLTETHTAGEVLVAAARARADGRGIIGETLVGYGFHDALWPEPASLAAIDAAFADIPAVMVSGDLHCGWMNSRAAVLLGVNVDETGVLAEAPFIAAMAKIDAAGIPTVAAYRDAAVDAASRGVVGIVDYENAFNPVEWPERVADGVDTLRVQASVWPDRLEDAIAAGWRTGDVLDDAGLVTMGALKIVTDGSLNTRTAWCWDPYPGLDASHPHRCGVVSVPIPELRRLLARAHGSGIAAAVHAIGDRANDAVLDAFADAGMPGSIEHAQLVSEDRFTRFAELGLVASVQPEHAIDDRDVADRLWAGRTHRSFAYGSLHRAGAQLHLGSDAPVAVLDPWISIAAAVSRTRDDREAWHPEQEIPIAVALAASVRTTVAVGEPADLVVTDLDPLTATRDQLRAMPVAATLCGGRLTYLAL